MTIPETVGTFDTAGSTVVFEVVVDDYAEVWVDGRLPRVLGQTGGVETVTLVVGRVVVVAIVGRAPTVGVASSPLEPPSPALIRRIAIVAAARNAAGAPKRASSRRRRSSTAYRPETARATRLGSPK